MRIILIIQYIKIQQWKMEVSLCKSPVSNYGDMCLISQTTTGAIPKGWNVLIGQPITLW